MSHRRAHAYVGIVQGLGRLRERLSGVIRQVLLEVGFHIAQTITSTPTSATKKEGDIHFFEDQLKPFLLYT